MNAVIERNNYRLSPMQQGMLFHSLREHVSGVDLEQITIRFKENINGKAFERAWRDAVRRHDILRTSFHWDGLDEPVQQVHDSVELSLGEYDCRTLSTLEQNEQIERYLEGQRQKEFDLTHPPLMRLALFKLDQSTCELVWSFHHLLLDGHAVALLLQEVLNRYEAMVAGTDIHLKPALPYGNYIHWLESQDTARADEFWKQQLKGFSTPTQLVIQKSRHISDGIRGEQEFNLSEETTSRLRVIAREHHLTLNTLVQGAWALLLSCYSREEDIVFGVVRACRRTTLEESQSIVGLFINTLPLRVRVEPGEQMLAWLTRLRCTWSAMRDFEYASLADIQRCSSVSAGQPLFESLFNYQDPSWDVALKSLGGKWVEREFTIRSQSNYPLVVDAYGNSALGIKFLYHRSRFEDSAIRRLGGHFLTLLEGMATGLERPLHTYSLLNAMEYNQIVEEWNHTDGNFEQEACIHQLIEERAKQAPDALAVKNGRYQLNYRELNQRANLLAHHLRQLGVGPEICVGALLNRSVEMVVGLLAILKAGGAYVPLDPTSPQDRLTFIIKDAGIKILLADESPGENLVNENERLNVVLVNEFPRPKGEVDNPGLGQLTSQNRAYVIYTSGSSGVPKGVEVEHKSVTNLIRWHISNYGIEGKDRATQLAAPVFDASVWELWPYLSAGASLHIPDEETRCSPDKLVNWLTSEKITITFIPTPLAEAAIVCPWPANSSLRVLLTGGDRLRRVPDEKLPCALVNHYGPTENTVVTTFGLVSPTEQYESGPPIGRPIANTQVYILDKWMKPLPIGVPGELHIGGSGLARGYLNQPELTAQKFIENPFDNNHRARLYKTGDLARWLPDGSIEFIGRIDNQVKVRGFRIELGEVESTLQSCPAIQDVIVATKDEEPGGARLVAYLVLKKSHSATITALRDFARRKLPEYMVPTDFVFLEQLPLTTNGKVDRQALIALDLGVENRQHFVQPETPSEMAVSNVWCEVLGIKSPGVTNNFFELGGHSLLATQVISRLRTLFTSDLSLQDLFDEPTVRGLAGRLDTRGSESCKSIAAHAPNGGHFENKAMSFAQERLWFLEQLGEGAAANVIPMAIEMKGKFHLPALEYALGEIQCRHETLRTLYREIDGRPAPIVNAPGCVVLKVIDLRGREPMSRRIEAERLMREEAQCPFNLNDESPLRVKIVRLKDDDQILLLTVHHIACDGWSLGILYDELAELYQSFVQGRSPELTDLPLSYSEFACWQRRWLQGDVLERQMSYWEKKLAGALPALNLPTDYPRPAVQSYRGEIHRFTIPAKLTASLKALSKKEDVTLFMVLMGALQVFLHRYTNQDDIIVGFPIAGRTRPETEKLIGLFLNTLVLRSDLANDPAFSDFLKQVRQNALEAYAHQDVPFEKLIERLQLPRDLSLPPLFQVMFILQNEPLRPLKLEGLKLTPKSVHSSTAKFDLTFSVEERADELSGYVEFCADLFAPETIRSMVQQFITLLGGIVTQPEARLTKLPLLDDSERNRLLVNFNRSALDYPQDETIHELFEAQALITPDAVAVECNGQCLSYEELNQRADMAARKLRSWGVGSDSLVGICMDRCIEMAIGLLAVLKAGGAYVPLDPAYPTERLAFMAEDSGMKIMLTSGQTAAEFGFVNSGIKQIDLRDESFQNESACEPNGSRSKESLIKPANLAYVIYTSGSTGQPKGVQITHGSVANFAHSMRKCPGIKSSDTILSVTTLSFDISVLELLVPWSIGARVIIATREEVSDGKKLAERIKSSGATIMQATPATWRMLIDSGWPGESDLKILCGGEACSRELANELLKRGAELWNLYGPTETTVWSAVTQVQAGNEPPFIGDPIANTQLYVLGPNLDLLPVGIPGELFIGGDGLARGYLNRPELTAEKFISNPFSEANGEKLYRTGDLVRRNATGGIQFLGRQDNQVKLRGFRIELGEIEAALARHPALRQAVATINGAGADEKRLTAYLIVVTDKPKPNVNELRRHLQQTLPEYMIPSSFVFVDAFPLTPNRKIDRKALSALPSVRPDLGTPYNMPVSDLEKSIARIWRELLQVEKAGLNDNFFDLGGHSLLLVQLQTRLHEVLNKSLSVVELFQHPTIHALATHLTAGRRASETNKGTLNQERSIRRKFLQHEAAA